MFKMFVWMCFECGIQPNQAHVTHSTGLGFTSIFSVERLENSWPAPLGTSALSVLCPVQPHMVAH